ncbi:MAG: hypothetical protein EP330_12575 [Deltaproteobacteria bacterium]|nr:MAG: hypothetical protein EP330_12575 [Deltaproteobacteria bacterium]
MTRWLRIAARTVHLGAMAFVLVGACDGTIPGDAVAALVASGGYLVADDVRKHGPDLFRYLQFWAVVAKLLLLTALLALPDRAALAGFAALIVGSVVSHAPGWFRQHPLVGVPGPCAQPSTDPPT